MNMDRQRHEATGTLVYNSETGQVRSSKNKGRVGRGDCFVLRKEVIGLDGGRKSGGVD
jgi:hypothetical protein